MDETVVDAVDLALSTLESRDEVAYAEVGGLDGERIDAVATDRGRRNGSRVPITGVWCRVFADGAAGYRYGDSVDADDAADTAERAVRAAKQQATDRDTRYDAHSVHRGVHEGWAAPDDRLGAHDPDEVLDRFAEVVEGTIADRSLSRARVRLRGDRLESSVATTTGGAVRTALDRIGVDATFEAESASVRRRVGSTTGAALLDALPDRLAAAADALERLETEDTATDADVPTGEGVPVLLAPAAAGQLAIALSRWLTADARYAGTAPLDAGDRIAPSALTIHDGVRSGSWAARAYDAAVKPTQPVTVVDRGEVATLLHSTATAADRDARTAGNLVPGLSAEHAPRIAPRHLEIESGVADRAALARDAAVRIDRFGEARSPDPVLRKHRSSWASPDPIAAETTRERLRSAADEDDIGRLDLPVAEGVRLDGAGEPSGRLDGVAVAFDLDHLRTLAGVGRVRETVTAIDAKHKTRLPVAATAPALALSTTLSG